MPVTLLRHTRTAVGEALCYGQLDVALADSFFSELASVLAACPSHEIIFSSPLLRCARLAAAISAQSGANVVFLDDLKEMNFGSWQGLLWSAVPRGQLDAWAADFWHAQPHGGENVARFVARVRTSLQTLMSNDVPSLVVTHGGVIRAALAQSHEAEAFSLSVPYGSFHPLHQIVEW